MAALIGARWLSPCGTFRRNSPFAGAISSLLEADVVGELDQVIHQFYGLIGATGAGERFDQPKRAGKECAFGAGQAVIADVAVGVNRCGPCGSRPRDVL